MDIERIRNETPSCKDVIHFENAGSSLMPQPVVQVVKDHLELEVRLGGYRAKSQRTEQFENVYQSIARFIGAKAEEIALLENATRAWCAIFYSIPFSPGDVILTVEAEYASNYIAMLQVAQRTGAKIQVVPSTANGSVDLEKLEAAITDSVKLIALTHTPTNGGLVNPAEAVGAIAQKKGVLFLLDACQTAGQYPLDVQKLGCDFLSATGRKYLRGPRGTGFLYVRQKRLSEIEPCMLDLHSAQWVEKETYEIRSDAKRFETWEKNYCDFLGLGAAVDYASALGIDDIWLRVTQLASTLRQTLSEIPEVTVRDLGEVCCGIVTFDVEGVSSSSVCRELENLRIHCSESTLFGTRLDMERRQLSSVVRASLHYFNTEEEIGEFCRSLRIIISK